MVDQNQLDIWEKAYSCVFNKMPTLDELKPFIEGLTQRRANSPFIGKKVKLDPARRDEYRQIAHSGAYGEAYLSQYPATYFIDTPEHDDWICVDHHGELAQIKPMGLNSVINALADFLVVVEADDDGT